MGKSTIAKNIKSSQKKVTILFTDIEGSTQHWETLGDIGGRLMMDQHNRLLFPVIKKFNGKVIKTIGDAIMAQFKKPENALKASIAMQQALHKEREENSKFNLNVRIGIHYGNAIVEHNDVYGDVVNVAARVEEKANGNEILISENSIEKIKTANYKLIAKTKFVPKGKKKSLKVYKCDWEKHPDLIKNIKFKPILPVVGRQKIEIFIYGITCLFSFYFFYIKYIRYLVGDFEFAALLALNPAALINGYPNIIGIVSIIISVSLLGLFIKIRTIPVFTLRFLKGGFSFCICFFIIYLVAQVYTPHFIPNWNKKIFGSDHLFVEVLEKDASIYEEPAIHSKIIMSVRSGLLLLLNDVSEKNGIIWNKILVKKNKFGWIPRVLPPEMGIPEKRVTIANKFYFKYNDLYMFLFGLIGMIWGLMRFSVRPS